MSYQVALLNFEGPLDLLLQLIERSDLEITDISLSDITSQYLSYIAELPSLGPGDLNQFLELASRLIYLKSVALLPYSPDADSEEEIADLTEQLAQYQQYQSAARYFESLLRKNQPAWPRQAKPELPAAKLPLPNIDLGQLRNTFTKALTSLPQSTTEPALVPKITLAEMSKRISLWLDTQTYHPALDQFFGQLSSPSELIVAFLAILELMRRQSILVVQDSSFGNIIIQKGAQQTGVSP